MDRTKINISLGTLLCCAIFCCTACEALGDTVPIPPTSPIVSPTITNTIIWFPSTPSATLEARPTLTATINPKPAIGDRLFTEDFHNDQFWNLGKTAPGTISIENSEITLAVSQKRGALNTLFSQLPTSDFYLEITAHPSLCKGGDSYGILFRAASGYDTYRYSVSCAGQVRMEKAKGGRNHLIKDWMYSGQIPPGSPLIVRLGIWVVKDEFRFFANDIQQFWARDSELRSGHIGLFAMADSDTPLTVNFSDLTIDRIDSQSITPTLTPTITPTPTRIQIIVTPPQ